MDGSVVQTKSSGKKVIPVAVGCLLSLSFAFKQSRFPPSEANEINLLFIYLFINWLNFRELI